ncbi:MAG: hypothetical protein M3Z37_11515 [Candidatus Eremiobacteraeota bacterium]|nr:hypothetical protein [Candidatus Eremiobacteraeota bacterium]
MSYKLLRPLLCMALLGLAFGSPAAAPAAAARANACVKPEYRQFDFWIGDWKVVDPAGKPQGTNLVTLIQNRCVLQEHWQGTDGSAGTSFNLYDRTAKRWHQTWVDNSGGILLLNGGLVNGVMLMTQPRTLRSGGHVIERIAWTKLTPDKVRQLWDRSSDGGKTWQVVFDGIYMRKGARQ